MTMGAPEVKRMLFLVLAEARDTIVGEAVRRLRAEVGAAITRIQESGQMRDGGILAARRMFYMLLEIDSAAEILELLGGEIIDNMVVDVSPVATFADLGQFFAKHPVP